MQIGKINLALANQFKLKGLGFLYPHDHSCPFKYILWRINDFRAGFLIGCIAESAGFAGIFLDQDLMSMLAQEFDSSRTHADAIFFSLDLF